MQRRRHHWLGSGLERKTLNRSSGQGNDLTSSTKIGQRNEPEPKEGKLERKGPDHGGKKKKRKSGKTSVMKNVDSAEKKFANERQGRMQNAQSLGKKKKGQPQKLCVTGTKPL